jgi:hypothetical protein
MCHGGQLRPRQFHVDFDFSVYLLIGAYSVRQVVPQNLRHPPRKRDGPSLFAGSSKTRAGVRRIRARNNHCQTDPHIVLGPSYVKIVGIDINDTLLVTLPRGGFLLLIVTHGIQGRIQQ